MKWQLVFLLLMGIVCRLIDSTCVFESDFGFILNCAFKKSGLFRVRNLGGVKGYVGLGFSVGDELGFQQSLSTLESNRRRSTDGQAPPMMDTADASKRIDTDSTGRSRTKGQTGRQVIPPFKPLPPTLPNSGKPLRLAADAIQTIPAPSLVSDSVAMAIPAFAALPESIARIPSAPVRQTAPVAFQNALQMANRRFQVVAPASQSATDNNLADMSMVNSVSPNTLSLRTLPSSTAPKISIASTMNIHEPSPLLMGHSIHSLAQASNISVETLAAAIKLRKEQLQQSTSTTTTTTTTTTSTTTTTTVPPVTKPPTVRPKYNLAGPNRVMNAPREYYPVSYDKNYDDNFTSKVELPETSFSCGDQKHFPGLYADEDLGCMVFHVCAFTDDGLVMKSFLCPESTLFDQTILKCNWWFYVDCKSSKKLYDSNIPISKSYQLMKALAFFSAYKNQSSINASNNT